MITIAIVDDHRLVQGGLKRMLQDQPDFSIIAEGCDGIEAENIVQKYKPDILLLDLGLPKKHGFDVIRSVTGESETKVIVISIHADSSYVIEALNLGALGYVIKDSPPEELSEAIRQVMKGQRYVSSSIRDFLLTKLFTGKRAKNGDPSSLTERESLVLKMAAGGSSAGEIGTALAISRRTAETHRGNLMRKLGLKSQTDLVRFAMRNGLIVP